MKTNQTLTVKTFQLEPHLERKLETEHSRLIETARKNARHLAVQNRPSPIGEKLDSYTGEFKAGCEKLSAEMLQALQPASNLPESKVDAEYYKKKDADCDQKIDELNNKNRDDSYSLDNFDPGIIRRRVWIALILTAIIFLGEVLFNTKAFLVTGENLLFALLLSICLSFSVFVFSHIAPMIYKAAKTLWQRRLVILCSILLVLGIFTALAIFRSAYLATHDIHIKPVYFVIINLFFFIVSATLSFFVLPTWSEIKENAEKLKIYNRIQRRKNEINVLNDEKTTITDKVKQITIDRIRILSLSKYLVDRIEKMYLEAVAVFKSTNLNFRNDGKCPDCFNEPVTVMDVNEQSFKLLNPDSK